MLIEGHILARFLEARPGRCVFKYPHIFVVDLTPDFVTGAAEAEVNAEAAQGVQNCPFMYRHQGGMDA